jgi:threonine synthase
MERLLYSVSGDIEALKTDMSAYSVSDEAIRHRIQQVKADDGIIICPHTATAFEVQETQNIRDGICVATAHPAKFPEIVEPLIGETIEIPQSLAAILSKPTQCRFMLPTLELLDEALS